MLTSIHKQNSTTNATKNCHTLTPNFWKIYQREGWWVWIATYSMSLNVVSAPSNGMLQTLYH